MKQELFFLVVGSVVKCGCQDDVRFFDKKSWCKGFTSLLSFFIMQEVKWLKIEWQDQKGKKEGVGEGERSG